MAVTLPSDLLVDVMQRADPARKQAAVARLRTVAEHGAEFAHAIDQVAPSQSAGKSGSSSFLTSTQSPVNAGRKTEGQGSSYRGFEKMVLRNLFESLLPTEKSGVFGTGPSAGVWRSMAAEQLANVYTDTGGLGIANMIQPSDKTGGPRTELQWPYFTLQPIRPIGSTDAT
jgi:peptidoglycan hydrolase FlgJ